jgi:hypothetical protein
MQFMANYFYLGTNGTYTNVWWACSRGNSRETGSATLSNNVIVCTPANRGFTQELLVPVRWGERLYLVSSEEMQAFCLAVTEGIEPRRNSFGDYLLRNGDWDRPAPGQPELPSEYAKFMRSPPPRKEERVVRATKALQGKITEVMDAGTAWIDLGSEHGLSAGMRLAGIGDQGGMTCIVDQVYGRQSRVKVTSRNRPRVGLRVRATSDDQ